MVTFLPWLLVSKGRLDARGIAHLAGQHGLGALLELNLVRSSVTHGSVLAVKGTEAALLGPDPNVFTFPDVPSEWVFSLCAKSMLCIFHGMW